MTNTHGNSSPEEGGIVRTETTSTPPVPNISQRSIADRLEQGFQSFSESLNEVLQDVTALEVNTMLVDNISGAKFLPEDAYLNIYFCLNKRGKIPRSLVGKLSEEIQSLEEVLQLPEVQGQARIPPDYLYPPTTDIEDKISSAETLEEQENAQKYWNFRQKITREYCQICSELVYDLTTDWGANLPFPYEIHYAPNDLRFNPQLKVLLKNSRFLRSLRKISELKAAVGQDDSYIYAQTVLQLDGDVINRYRRSLFEESKKEERDYSLNKKLVMEIHNESVKAGEEQWKGLLTFCVNIIRDVIGSLRNGR